MNLNVDFGAHELSGEAILTVRRLDPHATHLILDTRGLEVMGVDQLSDAAFGATEKLAPFWVSRPFHPGPADPLDGAALVIDLPPSSAAEERVRVQYETTPGAPGLHWGNTRPDGRGEPFFYALSQPFGARGWIPLQDTPRARMTFRLHVHTPPDMVALASGAQRAASKHGGDPAEPRAADHWLRIDRPVCAARLDLVVANLKFAAIGPDDGVYAAGWSARSEARSLAAAPAVRAAGERLLAREGAPRRDFVVMPPDFAQSAVVSPGLTLLSPTLFGGGARLVPLAARAPFGYAEELLVPAGRRDLWIGQAFAAYLQSRVVEALYGAPTAAVSDTLAFIELRRAMAAVPPSAQALDADAAARAAAPDGASIAYGKGRLFLSFLDATFGRARFDAFMRAFVERHAGRPVSTAEFVVEVRRDLVDSEPGVVRTGAIESWIGDPGIPANAVLPDAEALQAVDAARDGWLAGREAAAAIGARKWPAENWVYFLSSLPPTLRAAQMAELDAAYAPMRSGDAQLESLWLRLAVRAGYGPGLDAAAHYLETVGRVDLIVPLYARLMRSPDGARLARRVYSAARPGYDPLAAALLDRIVGPPTPAEADPGQDTPE